MIAKASGHQQKENGRRLTVAATKKTSLMVRNVPHKVAFFKASVAVSNLHNGS
jgi:hypothetical protein